MSPRRERSVFWALALLLYAVFFIQAIHTPTLLDDWYQLTWHRHHALGLHSIWEYGHYNYFHFNPRIGDVFLMIVNGPRVIHLVLTPLVQMALLPLAFACIFARWPRATLRDAQILVLLQGLLWLVMPIPGIVYFYRPFATNYLWSFTIMLALFAPYRLELARPEPGPSRHWLVPLMLPLGWLAGMGNEHTGPTAMLVMAFFVIFAWRRGRLRPWMIAGLVGLYIGYPMLFFAPGQTVRYAGMATKNSPVKLLMTRGLSGTWDIVVEFLGEAQIALDLIIVALLVAARRGGVPAMPKKTLALVGALVGSAGGMVATLFASPTVGERLFFAPALLFVGALVAVADWLFEHAGARRVLVIAAVLLFGYQIERFVQVSWMGWRENQHRLEQLESAKPDSVVVLPPYGMWKRSRYWWGDDFQYASLREYVANEVYDLRGIEYDRHLHWAEPTPPDRFVVTRTFDPPLTAAEDAALQPRYVPTFWEWALVQLRRSLVLGPIADVRGHKLVHYTVDIVGSDLADPKHRAQRVFDWTPKALTFVDGRQYDDDSGRPYIRVWKPSVPAGLEDAFVVGCGKTTRVEMVPDREQHVGPMLPVELSCRGTYTAFLCDASVCWLAGRYWR